MTPNPSFQQTIPGTPGLSAELSNVKSLSKPAEIRAFFQGYRNAFDALDAVAIARLYAVPSGIASDTGYEHWPAFEPIRENMIALCQLYKASGYLSARFEPERFIEQGEQYAIAEVRWHIERSNGQPPWQFNTTYNLIVPVKGGESCCALPTVKDA